MVVPASPGVVGLGATARRRRSLESLCPETGARSPGLYLEEPAARRSLGESLGSLCLEPAAEAADKLTQGARHGTVARRGGGSIARRLM